MQKSVVVIAAGLAAAGLLAAACGTGGPAGTGKDDNAFTYALGTEPETLNPALQDEHTDPVTELVFGGLTRHDARNEVVPGLAESWKVSDDERSYTFHLRSGLTWHDGEPLTSADVKFTIEAIREAGAEAPLSRSLAAVRKVTTPDPGTVRIALSEPFAPMLDTMSMGLLPEHVLSGKKITDPDFARRPVGAGPFRLAEYRPGRHAELHAFPGYHAGRPDLDKIVIKYVPDDSSRLVQLRGGEVDGAHVQPQQVEQAEDVDGVRAEVYPTADYRALMFNMTDPTFADKRVRRAMNYAVDREAIIDSVVQGYGKPARGPLDESPYGTDAADFRHDPAKVTELMQEAGYRRDGDGPWTKNGETVAFELSTFAEDSLRTGILNVAATQLTEAGFEVDPRPRPGDWVRGNWDKLEAFVVGWGAPYDPDTSVYGPFHSSEALADGGSNLGSYANPDVDEALEEARGTTGEAERKKAYARFQEALADDPPFVWIGYLQTINAVPDDLRGFQERTLGHHGYGFFWNAEQWHWD